ncbi:helix-turn-helix domain-containing protein [Actinomadura algeriensis]|uniref:Transcriptional regulator with XRE-family HTH domain n=1 Tax=Actinomadura algeriensis TaxID=1679523 RepID=A0ABR9JVI7_9ACTN|nr:helix-turn-helix transcriptional regulator [Actinomadura algeriensis]MBE1534581.1 transcriptional regulator with XRE-family HTH domain [Actinomadura algeriensis]
MTSPYIRRLRLATELRTLREQAGVTAGDLAQRIYRSRTLISKLENAHCNPNLGDVSNILNALDVTGEKVDEIFTIARDAAARGWWDSYGDAMGARQRMYANIESGAATIRGYNQFTLPGLLQSPEFTQALIAIDKHEGTKIDYVPERSLEARRRRQEAVFQPDGPYFETVLDEFVLRRLAVPTETLANQLHHMVGVLTREPRFTVLVLPTDARLSPGRLPVSGYMIYTFPDPGDPAIAVAESVSSCTIHAQPEEVAQYERLHDRLREAALPALDSLSLLADTADRLSEQVGHGK